jgi:membrane protein implicated in regulation of membrane protease activity
MTPRLLAALGVLFTVLTRAHLSVTAAGVTVSVWVPWLLLGAVVLALAVLSVLIWRALSGSRSHPPDPRPVYVITTLR